MTAAPFGHGSDRRWGDSAPGTSMPGAAVCGSGLRPRFGTQRAPTPTGGPYRASVHGCNRAPAPQPQQASERRPGPPAGCPPCRAGRSGAPARARLSHFRCVRWRILAPMAATAVHVRSPGPARARRLPRVGDDRLVARVRAGDDAAFEIIYDRYYRGLLAFCGHMLGSRHEAEDALQHSFASAYRALRGGARRHRAAPVALHDRAQPLPVGPARAARAASPPTGSRPRSDRSKGCRRRSSSAPTCASWWTSSQRLPDDQRAALVLFELGDQSHEQIAAVLGVRREKVKALVFQAREALMRARDARASSVRRDPRAARHGHRPRPAAQRRAQAHRPLSRLRGLRARGSPPAGRVRGASCRWRRPSA